MILKIHYKDLVFKVDLKNHKTLKISTLFTQLKSIYKFETNSKLLLLSNNGVHREDQELNEKELMQLCKEDAFLTENIYAGNTSLSSERKQRSESKIKKTDKLDDLIKNICLVTGADEPINRMQVHPGSYRSHNRPCPNSGSNPGQSFYVNSLVEMGFEENRSRIALRMTNNDFEEATNILLNAPQMILENFAREEDFSVSEDYDDNYEDDYNNDDYEEMNSSMESMTENIALPMLNQNNDIPQTGSILSIPGKNNF